MSSQITTAFVQQYSNNVQMLSQQKGSLLRGSVDSESIVGKNAFFDQVGTATAVKRVSRHSDTPQIDTPHSRRRVSMVDYEYADLIDNQDKIRTLIDPTSSYALAAAYAIGRAMDDEIISAVSGTAFTGETGSVSTALPSSISLVTSVSAIPLAKLPDAFTNGTYCATVTGSCAKPERTLLPKPNGASNPNASGDVPLAKDLK